MLGLGGGGGGGGDRRRLVVRRDPAQLDLGRVQRGDAQVEVDPLAGRERDRRGARLLQRLVAGIVRLVRLRQRGVGARRRGRVGADVDAPLRGGRGRRRTAARRSPRPADQALAGGEHLQHPARAAGIARRGEVAGPAPGGAGRQRVGACVVDRRIELVGRAAALQHGLRARRHGVRGDLLAQQAVLAGERRVARVERPVRVALGRVRRGQRARRLRAARRGRSPGRS